MEPQQIAYSEIDSLQAEHSELRIHDKTDYAVEELYDIAFPAKKDTKTEEELRTFKEELLPSGSDSWGTWFYYPWLNELVHFPPKEQLRALRTSRNRNLITSQEQAVLYKACVLVVGMSVGSNIVEALVSQGISGKLILVDMDIIEPSNLNRIRSPYHHVGLHKVEAISRKVWEVDPYIEIIQLLDGLHDENLRATLDAHKVDIIVDEMDSLRMKIILREEAKKHRIAVVMAADDGDDALLDIERHDLREDIPLFEGRIPDELLERLKTDAIPRTELGPLIGKYFVGADNIPLRMFESLGEVGKSLPSWPQLGGAAALSGISLSYVIRKILLHEKVAEGRILVSIEGALDLEHKQPTHQEKLSRYRAMLQG